MTTTNQLLGKVRRRRRRHGLAKMDFELAILEACEAGVPMRLVAVAAGIGTGSVHRLVHSTQQAIEEAGAVRDSD